MFGVVPKAIWSVWFQADPDNLIALALRSLVVESAERRVLIDTGIGHKQGADFLKHLHPFGGSGLLGGLKQGGYEAEDITDVILTHLHFDHCGGSLERHPDGSLYPVFPHATYHVSQKQWENASNPNIREADAILPENIFPLEELGVLNQITEEGPLMDGLDLRMADGHTPGQLVPVIRFGKRFLIYGADLFPTRAHIPVKYNMAYDLEVTRTMQEKERFLDQYAGNGHAILFEHDTETECGIPVKTRKGYRLGKTLTLEQWISESESG